MVNDVQAITIYCSCCGQVTKLIGQPELRDIQMEINHWKVKCESLEREIYFLKSSIRPDVFPMPMPKSNKV